jgi:hypothetical protein
MPRNNPRSNTMSHIVFRKSINTNSFGLRGYWAYDTKTYELHSFATSRNIEKWSTVTNLQAAGFELLQHEGTVPAGKVHQFLAVAKSQKQADEQDAQ